MNHGHRAFSRATVVVQYMELSFLSLAVVTGMAARPAKAATLPAGSTNVQCSADGNSSFHSTECTVGGFPGVPSSAFATATLSGVPFVSTEVTSPPAGAFGAGASATALYYFQVTGGNVGDVVPLGIEFSLNAFSTDESWALAKMLIYTSALGVTHVEEVCTDGLCEDKSLSDILSIPARSGAPLDSVTLNVQAHATATHFSNELARAFADPYIFIDPAFPNASLYSIVVSPGVGNMPRVPEPATLWLIDSVLGALSLIRRRK
jgi:hypothetical protein